MPNSPRALRRKLRAEAIVPSGSRVPVRRPVWYAHANGTPPTVSAAVIERVYPRAQPLPSLPLPCGYSNSTGPGYAPAGHSFILAVYGTADGTMAHRDRELRRRSHLGSRL